MENHEKIININQAKQVKDSLEEKFVDELREDNGAYVPKEAWDFFNIKMSNLQTTVENQNSKIDRLLETSGALINEIRKQTIDETRPACKISRDSLRTDAITVKSLNRHLDFYIFTGHIAELFQIFTKDKKGYSSSSASNMMKDLCIKDDNNFSYLDHSSKKIKVRKYSYDVFDEIVSRLKNPAKYNLDIEITAKWITKIKLPSPIQIEEYRENIKKGL